MGFHLKLINTHPLLHGSALYASDLPGIPNVIMIVPVLYHTKHISTALVPFFSKKMQMLL